MCFPSKKDHHPKERKRKRDGHHYNEQPLPPGVHGGQPGGIPGDSGKEREEDPTVAEAPDQMPECDLEPFSWRRQHFTADQLM